MARNLNNKLAVITGGVQGIGLEITKAFLNKGVKQVILLDVNEKVGAEIVNTLNSAYGENKAVFIKCDITTDLEAVSKLIFDRYKTVDILVNNAGVFCEDNPKKCMAVNATAVIEWTLKFWEHMRKDKGGIGGTILNTGSIYSYRIDPFCAVYRASKFAVLGFTKTLGLEYHYAKSGVRVVAICPGYTRTKIVTATAEQEQVQQEYDKFLKTVVWQDPSAVGRAAVEVFERADSGTAWCIEGDRAIEEV
ncbi:15-hydroxyprostaglandin dehydrogenase [NAD(+)]-like [Galleria mellonella]|uniref:15-hydroxyprostaglandin dehydrogenase [NAD(+)]-like n=1 Tax=Galleria mellonella TaxID=7137 RepID=A0A6J1WNT0_GALME|nr:15-hydroxyprostaglandin dehydrogenase [NAD(+)]-like [Galleria mellonella]